MTRVRADDACIFLLLLFQGFIVPDELGYLNNLGKYEDKDVFLQLPG
jgi:hypothetical protein